ncbi:MAG: hypothetical protein JRE23_14970 [Deltaproteobacteria bacterium]|nr:hypothetical protein [Deltaproteobacteria bacterium]
MPEAPQWARCSVCGQRECVAIPEGMYVKFFMTDLGMKKMLKEIRMEAAALTVMQWATDGLHGPGIEEYDPGAETPLEWVNRMIEEIKL